MPARTAAELARDALRDALLALGAVAPWDTSDRAPGASDVDRWADDGESRGRRHADERAVGLGERDAWAARTFARDHVYVAVVRYAQALRREGVALPAALVAVRATVRDGAVLLAPAAAAAVRRGAARCCLEAFYAH